MMMMEGIIIETKNEAITVIIISITRNILPSVKISCCNSTQEQLL